MDPLEEYASRCERWRVEQQMLQRQFIRIGNWRLGLGIVAAVLAYLAFGRHLFTAWALIAPAAVFVGLVIWHARVIARRTLAERAIRYYERGMARLKDRWIGKGSAGEQFRDTTHVYAEDLDLFGKGSLFELIASTRTTAGERTLANWLLAPATREEAMMRQGAVRELAPRLELREDLALLGEDLRAELDADGVQIWGSSPALTFARGLRGIAFVVAITSVGLAVAVFAQALPIWTFAAILAGDLLIIWRLRARIAQITSSIETPAHGLRILALVLERLERERFQSQRLQNLRASLEIEGLPASKRIARLQRWIDWLDSGDHFLIRLVRPIVLWREQMAMGIEAWRQKNGQYAERWLRAVAEFEALSSIASIAFERPGWAFPLLDENNTACFEAEGLQHPLMSPAKCVANDVALGGGLKLLIVSGSNMSGKSTLLRSVGLNCVLAWAGGPVAAKKLRISSLHPGASIRTLDSLHDNRSRFFAEISRISQIARLTKGNGPVLFLLDELLSGTNSNDRRIGAAGIVRKLVENGAIGLITTHDLALANIEQDLGSRAANVHFEDRIIDGRIEFDYRLRPGIVTHSNALELMRAVGLEL